MDKVIEELVAAAGLSSVSSAAVVTPQFPESRHVVFLMLGGRGSLQAVVKVARRREDHGLCTEAAALRRLRALWPEGGDTYPTVLSATTWRGHDVLAESAVDGRTLTHRQVRRAPSRYVPAYLSWVASLPRAGRGDSHGWLTLVQDSLTTLERHIEPDAPERKLSTRIARFLDPLGQVPLQPTFEHGDMSAPNLLWRRAGPRVGVVDWELGREHGMPAYDAAVFLAFAAFATAGVHGTEAEVEVFRREFLTGDGRGRRLFVEFLRQIDVPDAAVDHVLVAIWTRYALNVFSRLAPRSDRQPADDVAPLQRRKALAADFRAGRNHALWRALADANGLW